MDHEEKIIKRIIDDTISIKFGYVIESKYTYTKSLSVQNNKKYPLFEVANVEACVVTPNHGHIKWKFNLPMHKRLMGYDLKIQSGVDDELICDVLFNYRNKFENSDIEIDLYSIIGLNIVTIIPEIPINHYVELHNSMLDKLKSGKYRECSDIRVADVFDDKSVNFYNRIKSGACCKSFDEIFELNDSTHTYMYGWNYDHGKY